MFALIQNMYYYIYLFFIKLSGTTRFNVDKQL